MSFEPYESALEINGCENFAPESRTAFCVETRGERLPPMVVQARALICGIGDRGRADRRRKYVCWILFDVLLACVYSVPVF